MGVNVGDDREWNERKFLNLSEVECRVLFDGDEARKRVPVAQG